MRAIILVAGKSIFCRYWEDMTLEETLAFCKCFVAEAGRSHLDFFLLLSYDLEQIFPPGSRIIVQEYIEGTDISVSLISDGKKAIPISLNQQFVELKNNKGTYEGGKLPYESKYEQEAFEIATKAVEAIDGIKGFVGVDLLINADEKDIYSVYLLEINSRFTTPYVGLSKVANFNIGKSIIELIDGKITIDDIDVSLDGEVEFKKSGDLLEIRRI